MTHELTITDGFDAASRDPAASPIRGGNWKFKDGDYYSFADQIDVDGASFAMLDRRKGWQKLAKGCSPEYLMQEHGKPKPPQPHVDEKDWPLDLNGKPAHPWKLTHYLYLLNVATGEISTLWTDTVGGNIAVDALTDQVSFMRQMRPNALPVIALESRDMPTRYGGTTPRPHFRLLGWRERSDTNAPAQLTAPESKASGEALEHSIVDEKPTLKKEPPPTNKGGVTRFDSPELTPMETPSSEEVFDDEVPF
jgi:hypothetical protein